MVKVTDIKLNATDKSADVSLFADAKADVQGLQSVTDIVGFPAGYSISPGSSVITAAGEFAFRKSDDTWNWVGEEES